MIIRHPHVFADTLVADSNEVLVNWDNIKKDEKKITSPAQALRRVPPYLPALIRAQKIQGKARTKYDFGIKSEQEAIQLLNKSVAAVNEGDSDGISDALFAICSIGEMKGIDLEATLSACTDSFVDRFESDHKDSK